jgi:cell division transport system permease protein
MSTLPLSFSLGLGTLRSRPTLTILAALMLALGTAILAVLFGAVFLLQSLQTSFATALTLELELIHDAESSRAAVMTRAEAWPGIESVQYVPPEVTLREIEKETGEDLERLFGANPFPPMVRVRFTRLSLQSLDSLAASARVWPEVADVAYPRAAWSSVDRLSAHVQGGFGKGAAALTLVILVLVGLCLRAQVRNRADTWDLLLLMGSSPRTIRLALFVQQLVVGVLGGLLACGLLAALGVFLRWLTLRPVEIPLWFYFCTLLAAMLLSILAGQLSPRRYGTKRSGRY